ncbi:MAG: hypothetical protein K2N25_01635 [Muribaculaceae bacterium]|nr:hypothetical protein [Muribaculaceae bacterium]
MQYSVIIRVLVSVRVLFSLSVFCYSFCRNDFFILTLRVSNSLGMSEAVVGLTIVAAGTSLPEI